MNNNRETFVSILIASYNSKEYLAATLDSCVNQTWSNIEVVIVDDNSNDGSYDLAVSYQKKYPDLIKVYRNYRKGACAARNYAFEKSSGEYIQYLDADDLLNSQKIESQMNLLLRSPTGTIAHCQWGRFYQDLTQISWKEQEINKDFMKPVNWLVDSWNGKGMGTIHSWLIPRHVIKNAGSWSEELKINQDGEFFSRVILRATAIKYCQEAKVYYRSGNPLSISQINSGSFTKASSLLRSYELYHLNILQYEDSEATRRALGNNYLNYIYLFKNNFPDLAAMAEKKFQELGLGKMWPVGGANFQRIAKVVGFNNALKVKALLG